MLEIVNGLDMVLPKPQSHEICARLEEDLPKQERERPGSTDTETDELSFLSRIRVDDAISIRVAEDTAKLQSLKPLKQSTITSICKSQPG